MAEGFCAAARLATCSSPGRSERHVHSTALEVGPGASYGLWGQRRLCVRRQRSSRRRRRSTMSTWRRCSAWRSALARWTGSSSPTMPSPAASPWRYVPPRPFAGSFTLHVQMVLRLRLSQRLSRSLRLSRSSASHGSATRRWDSFCIAGVQGARHHAVGSVLRAERAPRAPEQGTLPLC